MMFKVPVFFFIQIGCRGGTLPYCFFEYRVQIVLDLLKAVDIYVSLCF